MLKGMMISHRLGLGFFLVILLIIGSIIPVVINQISNVIEQAERRELSGLYKSARAEIESEGRLAEALSYVVSSAPTPKKLMAEGNREQMAKNMVPVFKDLKKKYAVRQWQFHTPEADSFFRVHKPAKFGDNLSSFRHTVVETNRQKQTIHGLEKGVAGLGIRGLSPVSYEGKHIGSVEFGMSFGQAFFDKFKSKYGVEVALYIDQKGEYKAFGNTMKTSLLSADQIAMAMKGETVVLETEFESTPYALYAQIIEDFRKQPVGVLMIAMDRSTYAALLDNALLTTVGIGVLAIIMGLFVAWLISRSITRPLSATVSAMNDIAKGEGDLTQRLNISSRDEISLLATAFNQFVEKVHGIMVSVSSSIDHLSSSASHMTDMSQETLQGAEKQQVETEQVVTAMNEMSSTVQEVARHAVEAASAANNASVQSKEGSEVVNKTVSAIQSLSSEVNQAGEVIRHLEKDSEAIDQVTDVIRDVAEQTNLLALNAAIEAARAGEQGRGFAVVADEVRTLASRTQDSTLKIRELIEQLQARAGEAVKVMESNQLRANESVEQANSAGESLKAITESVSTITDMNTQIASAAEEQSSVAEEINRNVVNINEIVNQSTENVKQTSISSEELSELANELKRQVGSFKL